jgi:hypothetical protein
MFGNSTMDFDQYSRPKAAASEQQSAGGVKLGGLGIVKAH